MTCLHTYICGIHFSVKHDLAVLSISSQGCNEIRHTFSKVCQYILLEPALHAGEILLALPKMVLNLTLLQMVLGEGSKGMHV